MSKIKDALNIVREYRPEANDSFETGERRANGHSPRRTAQPQTANTDWLDHLHVMRTTAADNPESRVIIGDNHDERVISAYKMLRTRTLQRMRRNDWHIIGVTSAMQGDGKSLTALNLAISLAKEETLTVALVELDLRRPSVCQQLGVDPVRGLPNYLEGTAKLDDVLFRPEGTERLVVLPNTEVYRNSSETLSSPKIADLISKLRDDEAGRVVICDLPPFLVTDDVLAFAPLVDAFLVVVSEGATSRDVLKRGVDILQELPILGVLLNKSEEATSGYYY